MTESRFRSFLKGHDRFSLPVMLKYKNEGAFRTTCGGIATIVASLLLLVWFSLTALEVYIGDISSNTVTIT